MKIMLYWGRRSELQTHYQPWQESHLKEMAEQNEKMIIST